MTSFRPRTLALDGVRLSLATGGLSPAPAARVSRAARVVAAHEPAPQRLLFVDCEPDARWLGVFARRGIEVRAVSAPQALELLGQVPACLVLDADRGSARLDTLRGELGRAAALPAVALLASATALFSTIAEWREYRGVSHVLLKPVEVDELSSLVEQPLAAPPAPRLPSLERLQREYIRAVLDTCQGNVSEAARQLGMYRQSLQRMLRRHPFSR